MEFSLFGRTINFSINNSVSDLPAVSDEEKWRHYLAAKGYTLSRKTAIQVAAVIRCVDVVAKTIASLPLNLLIDREKSKGKDKAKDHSLYKLLYRLPNRYTTAYDFWHMYISNLMLTSGAYAKIARDHNGFIRQLWNIPTANVNRYYNKINGERYIVVTDYEGNIGKLREGDYMYTPGFRLDKDETSEDALSIASEVLGLTFALNNYANDFFRNGSNLGGFVECDGELSDKSFKRFQDSWQESYAGVRNQHKVGFLEGGLKFNAIEQNPNDAQALESRKFAVVEICRIFGVPPHKVFELDRATFNNIEELNIEFVQEAITPCCVRLEQTMYKDLLTTKEQENYYAKFNINGLLRGNLEARGQFYHQMRNDGVYNANDIRDLEDMNPISKEEGGDAYLINGNMISLENAKNNLPKSMQGASKK